MKALFGLSAALGLAAIVLMPAIGSAEGYHGHGDRLVPPAGWEMVSAQQDKAAIMADVSPS